MIDSNSLIEIAKLAGPAKVLIDKVSDAVGGIFLPYQITRVARAEVEAGIIKAKGQLVVTEIEQRGLQRLIYLEGKKQQNIENVTKKAIPFLNESSDPKNIDNDWLINFFDKCNLITNDDMQTLWGKILAGEANRKGSFSKRTINTLTNFELSDAHLFTNLCRFGVSFGQFTPLVFDVNNSIYHKYGINFSTLNHLESIGLISFNHITGYVRQKLSEKFSMNYFDEIILINLVANETQLQIGNVLLTEIGLQLSGICGAEKINDFPSYIKSYWDGKAT